MTSAKEVCAKCPLNEKSLQESMAPIICSALGGFLEFSRFAGECIAVKELEKQGTHITTFTELLRHFPKLINIDPNEDGENNPRN